MIEKEFVQGFAFDHGILELSVEIYMIHLFKSILRMLRTLVVVYQFYWENFDLHNKIWHSVHNHGYYDCCCCCCDQFLLYSYCGWSWHYVYQEFNDHSPARSKHDWRGFVMGVRSLGGVIEKRKRLDYRNEKTGDGKDIVVIKEDSVKWSVNITTGKW